MGSGDRHRARAAAQPVHAAEPGADGKTWNEASPNCGGLDHAARWSLFPGWKLHRQAQFVPSRRCGCGGTRTRPTRPSGWLTSWHRARRVTAALQAAPDADAVFVAHTGLEHLVTVADLWRGLPMDTEMDAWWQVPADEAPRAEDAVPVALRLVGAGGRLDRRPPTVRNIPASPRPRRLLRRRRAAGQALVARPAGRGRRARPRRRRHRLLRGPPLRRASPCRWPRPGPVSERSLPRRPVRCLPRGQ